MENDYGSAVVATAARDHDNCVAASAAAADAPGVDEECDDNDDIYFYAFLMRTIMVSMTTMTTVNKMIMMKLIRMKRKF